MAPASSPVASPGWMSVLGIAAGERSADSATPPARIRGSTRSPVRHGATPVQIELAWLLSHEGVATVAPAESREQVEEHRAAAALRLDGHEHAMLDDALSCAGTPLGASAAAAATPREASRPRHVLARNDYTIMVVVLRVAASIAAAVARRTRPTNTRPP